MRYAFAMNAHKVLSHHYLTIFNIHTPSVQCTQCIVSQYFSIGSGPRLNWTLHYYIQASFIYAYIMPCTAWLLVAGLHCTFIQHFYGEENAKCELRFASEPMFLLSLHHHLLKIFFLFCIFGFLRFIGRLHLPLCEHWLWMRCKFVFTYDRTPFWP